MAIDAEVESIGAEGAGLLSALQARIFTNTSHGNPWSPESWAQFLATSGSYALIIKDKRQQPLGFLAFRLVLDEAEILSIGVLPLYQRLGLARRQLAAMDAAIRMSRPDVWVYLEVAEDNLTAISFYEEAGFRQAGRRPGYYHGPDGPKAALILAREPGPGV